MDDWMAEVQEFLGPPDRQHPAGGWERVAAVLGAQPPTDFVRFADTYGACILKQIFYVNHPRSVELETLRVFGIGARFLRELRESEDEMERIPYPLMGEVDGMLQFAHTDLGDYCFLRHVGNGSRWVVNVWYREGEWHECDLTFSEWLVGEVRGVRGECNVLRFSGLPRVYEAMR